MNHERWQQICDAFADLVELPAVERAKALANLAERDADLVVEVRKLLDGDADPNSIFEAGVLDEIAGQLTDDTLPALADGAIGSTIGPYRLDRVLGQGGMGVVYEASRTRGNFEQRVALKLIRRGLATAETTGRFRAERQILARLTHPNIAHLLDGGVTDDDRPWFALELVEGQSILDHVEAKKLSIEGRIWLFLTVCDAVQFAHRNLVVHRDLKPNNVLVSEEGTVKLVDFGIAKLLDDAEDPAMTRTGARVMTPAYASPEQIRGEPATTAADIYALGALLYELITGRRPFGSDLSPRDLEEAILTKEPERPSTASRKAGSARTSGLDPNSDLDNICLMALRKDPDRRYASVAQLADDVRRFLTGHPVHARPDSAAYRFRKFVQRNRASSFATAAAVVAVAGTVAFYTGRLGEQRDVAQLEARRSAEVVDFLTGLFQQASPSETLGQTVTVQELLERGASSVQRDLASDPDVQATMLGVIGKVYSSMGIDSRAVELLRPSYEHLRDTRTPPDLELAQAAGQLGSALRNNSEFEEARTVLGDALDQYSALLPPTSDEVINAFNALALVDFEQGNYDEARPVLTAALERAERSEVASFDLRMRITNNLARLEREAGNYDLAESLYRTVLAERRATEEPLSPNLLSSIANLAAFLISRGNFDEGIPMELEALAGREQVYGSDSPVLAVSLNNLASMYKQQGRPDLAEPHQRRALEIYETSLGPDHQLTAMSYNNLANILHDQGRLDEAIALHQVSLPLQRKLFGEDHARTAGAINNLAAVYKDQGNLADAVPLYRQTLDIDLRSLGGEHPFVAQDMINIASALTALGEYAEAEALFDSAAAIQNRNTSSDPRSHASRKTEYALLLLRTGRLEEAERLTREALALREEELPPESWLIAVTRANLGEILVTRGEEAEALPMLEVAHARLVEVKGADARETRAAWAALERARRE